MTTQQVERHANSQGVKLSLTKDGRIACTNSKSMSPDLRGLIAAHKEGLTAELKARKPVEAGKAPSSTDDVSHWFWGFAMKEPVGLVDHRGGTLDVRKAVKRLCAKAPLTHDDHYALEEWLDDARRLRQAVEEGVEVVWPEEFAPADAFPELAVQP